MGVQFVLGQAPSGLSSRESARQPVCDQRLLH